MKAPLAQSLNLCLLIQFWNPPFIPLGSTKMRKKVFILNIEKIILQFDNHSLVRELPISGNKNRISSTSKKEKAEITSFLLSQSRGSETPNEDSASTQLEVETRIRFKVHSIMRGRPSLVTKIGRGITQIEQIRRKDMVVPPRDQISGRLPLSFSYFGCSELVELDNWTIRLGILIVNLARG